MKNLTKKLFLSMLTVAFAVVALGTTTFAWFTLSTDARIEAFGADVSGGEGFEIQVESSTGAKSNWYSGLVPSSAITAVLGPTNFEKFDANTPTSESIAAAELAFQTVKIAGGSASLENSRARSHVNFKLNFKLTDPDFANKYNLILNGFTFDTDESTVNDWDCDADFTSGATYSIHDKLQLFVEDSARMRIYSKETSKIYENKAGQHPAVTTDNKSGTPITNTPGISTTGFAAEYWKAKTSISNLPDIQNDYKNVLVEADGTSFGTLTDTELQLTIDIWVEGYDNECMNAIFSQKLLTSLSFKLVEA